MNLTLLSGGGEGRLSFVRLAQTAFAFLLRHGFVMVNSDSTFVRFESPTVFINVSHGRLSYHVDAEIGRLVQGDIYSIYEVLSVMAPSEVARSQCQTTAADVLERCLTDIADVLDRCCQHLLSGDNSAFDRLQLGVAPIRAAVTLKAQFGATIDRADRAWEAKDIRQAQILYEEAEAGLDEMRSRRLKYLREHQSGTLFWS